ncbi:MAG: hypothetical protein WCE75_14630 [Terracidiphilus sp.]
MIEYFLRIGVSAAVVLAFLFAFVQTLQFFRRRSLNELAARYGIAPIPRKLAPIFPNAASKAALSDIKGLTRNSYFSEMSLVRNVLDGEVAGRRVLIADTVLGNWGSRGSHCTILAIRTEGQELRILKPPKGLWFRKIRDWTVLSRGRILMLSWTDAQLDLERRPDREYPGRSRLPEPP